MEDAQGGEGDDFEVKPQRPVFDVPQVVVDAFFEVGVAAPAVHLRPAGNARFHHVFLHVAGDFVFELFDELWPLRTRADDGHFAFEDVPELRQFVNAQASEPAAERDSGFFRSPAPGAAAFFVVHRHGAVFDDVEGVAVPADAFLPVEDGAAARQPYPQGNEEE